jgi:hypothetical protein
MAQSDKVSLLVDFFTQTKPITTWEECQQFEEKYKVLFKESISTEESGELIKIGKRERSNENFGSSSDW